MRLYNTEKKRWATNNEVAKYTIMDAISSKWEFSDEMAGVDVLSEKDQIEVNRHIGKHMDAISKRFGYIRQQLEWRK